LGATTVEYFFRYTLVPAVGMRLLSVRCAAFADTSQRGQIPATLLSQQYGFTAHGIYASFLAQL